MKITNESTLNDLQAEFQAKFPYLKLMFFRNRVAEYFSNQKDHCLHQSVTVGEIRSVPTSGNLHLDSGLTAGALEQTFFKDFGLNIRVYRKSFGSWIIIHTSEAWTLKEQNLRGLLTEEKALTI